ncbi:GTP-binding protein LepA [Dialister histaminiformans]|uniref:Elongation factor 4 n=1 Tax=Allisonella histaminiformans TaxID=209880 RepID=A0A1G5W759_9FIRM|nr:translation elongation factor 4 [Allisonella histaminiformans]SDA53085.1 GTP-binding protein LepA [Allisonella histaminiformans]
MDTEHIRNFSIIAHIDHGKSTLADRLIELTGTVKKRDMEAQILDTMDLERERGITIKEQSARLMYKYKDGDVYELNLIDTPGHVDFNYEVSRSLSACEGAILIVDATQGVQAQTLANVYLALDNNLEIIPVINKIDLPSADPERVKKEVEDIIGLDMSDAIEVSAKTGFGVDKVLERIVEQIPAPEDKSKEPLQCLIFDSIFDSYQGAIAYVRVVSGSVRPGMDIRMMASGKVYKVTEVGYFSPLPKADTELPCGSVGFICASIKNVHDCEVGDTITTAENGATEALPGYRKALPMVFCGLYPIDSKDYDQLKDALEKLSLNDAALEFEPETSTALGFGFRCGFLGLLHMDVVQERLEREYHLKLITTAPSVIYKVYRTDGEVVMVDNPSALPPQNNIEHIEEPIAKVDILVPSDMVGAVMELAQNRRGEFITMTYLDTTRVTLTYRIPLSEIIFDFFDKLKSSTRGYASLDYQLDGYQDTDAVKLDILLNGDLVDALSVIVHRSNAASRGRSLARKLKDIIPRQQFEVPIQAAIGSKIVARETVKAYRKDVLAKCYGGDVSRKKKLLEKQKEGKKRMKQVGSIEIPQEAFMAVLQNDE